MSGSPAQIRVQQALALHRSGATTEAAALYGEVLQIEPDNADAPYYLGLIACQSGRFEEGADHARNCLRVAPDRAAAHVLLGRALCALHRPEQALPCFEHAVALAPALAQAHSHYADCLSELGRNAEAVESYDRSLALSPDLVTDWYNRGLALAANERHAEAVASFDRAIAADGSLAAARLARAKALSDLRRHDDALRDIDDLLAADPKLAAAWLGRGNILAALNRNAEALAAYDKALALRDDLAEAWSGRGHVLCNLKRYDDALSAHDRALQFSSALPAAWAGRGDVFVARGMWNEATAAYARAASLKPSSGYSACLRLYAKLRVCDWQDLAAETGKLVAMARTGVSMPPFAMLALPTTAADQLQFARQYVKSQQAFPAIWRGEVYRHDRIRIAYLSGDFHDHPVAHLTVGLFEHHDTSHFEVTGISFETHQNSAMQRRIENTFEHFIPAADKTESEIAEYLRASEIDIAVDLMGFTMNNRAGIFARRPAPIQLNYLGYPGTMGADYIDYILADSTIIPDDQRAFYSEHVVWLPDSYQANDRKRLVSERIPSRQECGLPEQGLVFCAFNSSYKITPQIFDVWMRILEEVDDAVLWLRRYEPVTSDNLRREAERRGVAAERLIFAPHVGNHADHLARYRCADLFLDTLPYNAHTTASDALWAGVPVLTCLGTTFAGRVAASVLRSIGLDELITISLEDYEALAIRLAGDPAALTGIREKLLRTRATSPLFDTALATQQIESAYKAMWELYQSGDAPRALAGRTPPAAPGRSDRPPQPRQDRAASQSFLAVRIPDGLTAAVPPSLSAITTYVLLEQERWFEKELDFLQCFLKPGMTAVDIGANLGMYSLPIARLVGGGGCVIAYEPGGEARIYLEQSRELNELANLDIRSFALSDSRKEGYLAAAASSELRALSSAGGERVQITSLDHESDAGGWAAVDFVKIDAEGEEERVLAGGRDFFATHSPLVMAEINAGNGVNERLRTLFQGLGYRLFRQVGGAPVLVPDSPEMPLDAYELNLFAAKPDRAEALAQQGLLAESIVEWAPVQSSGLDYENALIAFGAWQEAGRPIATRCAALAFALKASRAACAANASVERLSTWARIAWEWGARAESVTALTRLLEAVRERPMLREPFLPPSRANGIEAGGSQIEWLMVNAAEQYERIWSFSSHFAGASPFLDWLCRQRIASTEMLRRQTLVPALLGQHPHVPDRLCHAARDHLNADLWRNRKIPGTI